MTSEIDFTENEENAHWLHASREEDKEVEKQGEWVKEDAPQAELGYRWRNTETDELRYQEEEPGGDTDVDVGSLLEQEMDEDDGWFEDRDEQEERGEEPRYDPESHEMEEFDDPRSYLQNEVGIGEVNMDSLNDFELQAIADGFRRLDERGLVQNVEALSDETDGFEDAEYTIMDQTVRVTPAALPDPNQVPEDPVQAHERGGTNMMANLHPAAAPIHEAAHANHVGAYMEDREAYELHEQGKEFDDPEEEDVARRVSSYAGYNPLEFVAETFTGLMLGIDFDEEVMNLYEKYGGPDV